MWTDNAKLPPNRIISFPCFPLSDAGVPTPDLQVRQLSHTACQWCPASGEDEPKPDTGLCPGQVWARGPVSCPASPVSAVLTSLLRFPEGLAMPADGPSSPPGGLRPLHLLFPITDRFSRELVTQHRLSASLAPKWRPRAARGHAPEAWPESRPDRWIPEPSVKSKARRESSRRSGEPVAPQVGKKSTEQTARLPGPPESVFIAGVRAAILDGGSQRRTSVRREGFSVALLGPPKRPADRALGRVP